MPADYQLLACKDAPQWRQWLDVHHADADGVWLRLYKKGSGTLSITYDEALDEALCYGWIDGQVKQHDAVSYVQKFTPRRARSTWSKRNIEHVARLTKAGRMMPAGQAEVARAKADGRWAAAYDSPKNSVIPADFLEAVQHDSAAAACFNTLSKTNRFTIAYQLQTAKRPETRTRRFARLLAMLQRGEKPN